MPSEIGEPSAHRFTERALASMRASIRETGGREVFFAGTVNGEGLVESVRVVSRGHEGAAPAFLEGIPKGSVVVHNHPSGGIGPSEADLELASVFGFNGLGVYIVDNAVERVYVVVEPLTDTRRAHLDSAALAAVLTADGPLARALPHFELRPQQAEMMRAVVRAFNDEGIEVIEAPTGVGKTIAYLLPAVEWALDNKERVVISTRTINLQEQIVHKDVPVIEKCLQRPFNAVLVKGRHNYVCWRKFERALSESALFDDAGDQAALNALSEWIKTSKDGSLSDLPFVPPRPVWERVCSEADACNFTHCAHLAKCFVSKARRELAKADIIVANHHMLFSDLAVKHEMGNFTTLAVLPAYQRVIFDEAHSIEDSATEYLGVEATRNGAMQLIGRFIHMERGRERGLIPLLRLKVIQIAGRIDKKATDEYFDLIDNQLGPALAAAREGIDVAFAALRSLVAERCKQVGRDIKWRLTPEVLQDAELREIHKAYVIPAVEDIEKCVRICAMIARRLRHVKPEGDEAESPVLTEMLQLDGYQKRLARMAKVLAEGVCDALQPNTVRWIEIDSDNKSIVRIVRCPLNVGKPLAEWIYPNLKSIAMTSATLSVRQRFDFLHSRLGLDAVRERPLNDSALGSPFDFEQQAMLCLATDLDAPDSKAFLEQSVEAIRDVLRVTRGHALVLFTSFYALDHCFRRIEADLRARGITPLKQGGASRSHLLDRFREDLSSVLFATDSFWEGVDVAGEALQCVILPKLPFRVPSEPVLEARAEAIDAAGGNSFMEYTVPQAVIKFRQGFGRLIRRKTDRGAIVVLDKRIVTRHYGKLFLESLPGVKIVKGPQKGVVLALENFFGNSSKR